MNTLEAIYGRRSIRKFSTRSVHREDIEKILEAGTKAPSAMNRQPWRYVVLEGAKKEEALAILERRVTRLQKLNKGITSALTTAKIMRQAPVLILIYDAKSKANGLVRLFSSVLHVYDVQSIGASIQNLCLAAYELGLGTLWIGHMIWAAKAIGKYAGINEELIAAVSVGYPDESPGARPRKDWQEVTTWME